MGHNSSDNIINKTSKLHPVLIDASVFTSKKHCATLLHSNEKFYISNTLYELMFAEERTEKVSDPLIYILNRFAWRPLEYLPIEKLDLQSRLRPYKYKKKFVEEIFPKYFKSLLPIEVRKIILDEFSFLKEHSSILMSTRRIARHLHNWGIVFIDATNKIFDRKESLFDKIRGVRWIIGLPLAVSGVSRLPDDPIFGTLLAVGGSVLVLFDP